MKSLSLITDPVYIQKEQYSSYEKFWLKFINDKRDLPFIHLLTTIHLLVIPYAILLFTPLLSGWYWWLAAIPYFYISQFYFKGPFGLMLHCHCHRKCYKKPYQFFFKYMVWFICPFFGHTPESYFGHHMGMHHVENNMPDDTSSTMGYQRDSARAFIKYWLAFLFSGVAATFVYLFKRKRKKLYIPFSVGEISFFIVCIALCFVNFKATMVIFFIPLLFARLVMMLGNWTQHAFIDAEDPENLYTSSINCINTVYNHKCWNDGYHVVHHTRPGAHYTEHPSIFLSQQEEMTKNKTLVFDGIHYLHVFAYLLTKRYDKLAENLVNINNMFANSEEAITLMKARTRKIPVALS
ncbi:MAG: fatty acid desaturase [Terrimonas sp.]|nr:fatty acid desaturase [Terrimonas sp.]